MAVNLVSLVMQSLTSEVVGKIASALGLDRSTVQKAVSAAIPAILAAIAGAAAKPGGARRVAEAVSQEGTSVLSNLGKTLEGSGHKALAEQGSGLLGSLLGNSTQSGLASALGKFAGISEGTSSSLLGLLGPVVAATLGRQQNTQGLDASGLAHLLTAQKDNISAALPSGFANLLGGTDVLDSLGERAASTARSTSAAAHRVAEKTSSMNWLAWAIPLIALLALAWYFFGQQASKPVEPVATTTPSTPAPATSLTVDGVDLGASVTSAIDGLKTSLEGITDATTAQAALPKLQEATEALDKVSGVTGKLSAEQKTGLAALIAAALPALNPLFDKVLAIPGVSEIAKPAIDAIRTKLDAMVKA